MEEIQVEVLRRESQTLYGLWMLCTDRTLSRDIQTLTEAWSRVTGVAADQALPFFVLCKDYDPATGGQQLFVGSALPAEELEAFELPAGSFGRMTLHPAFRFLWGSTVRQGKRFFYERWLPASGYEAGNLEYELHTTASLGKKPSVEVYFAIREKAGAEQAGDSN